jgi:Protein of unknown function (DUF1761)
MQHTNVLAVFVAAIVAWLFGAAYYSVLCKKWIAAQGKTPEGVEAEGAGRSAVAKAAPFILSFLAELIMAGVLAGILYHIDIYTVRAGVISGALCWAGFVLTTVVVNNAYAFRRLALTAIDCGHWFGVLVIIGAILGGFGP